MSDHHNSSKPALIPALFSLKCPRCRKGDMYCNRHSYSKQFMKMHDNCPVCGQLMEIEPHFYYGTGYVSYTMTVALSVASFVAWWAFIGFSLHDSRFFWWIGVNAVLLLALQPYLMRLSRTIWLWFFVKYSDTGTAEAYSTKEVKAETSAHANRC